VKRRIFIGSSTEGLPHACRIKELLASFGDAEPVLWTEIFHPGLLTFEALENVLLRCCAAVFVASADDVTTFRGQSIHTPRANVMLEFGLVAGRIGRHSIALCLVGGAQLPSDLQGLTVIDMSVKDPPPVASSEASLLPEDRLRLWTTGLLSTADQIARTDILHGYSGRWEFTLQLSHWRGREVRFPSYAYVNGDFDLVISANGQSGKGFAQGRLNFKIVLDAAGEHTFQGDYRTAHEIASADCSSDGSLHFTSQAFAVGKFSTTGVAPAELSSLDLAEPWSAQWQLTPAAEPRSLEGTVSTGDAIGTRGTVKVRKA
jgi:hypothetical protein